MIGDNIKKRIDDLRLSVAEAAKRCGIPVGTMYTYITDKREPTASRLQRIAAGLNTTIDTLLKEVPVDSTVPSAIQPSGKEGIIKVPVVGEIHAGHPVIADESIQRYTFIYADKSLEGHIFALEVKGDSMSPDIGPGETCIIKKEITAENGNIVVALVNHEEVVIRKFFHSNSNIILSATNQAYPPILIKENEQFRIVGVVLFCQRRFK